MGNLDKDIKAYGIVVGGDYNFDKKNNSYFWAEVVPSAGAWYRQFLPSVKRWWFEIHQTESTPTDELGIGTITHAYTKYGAGGAWTLRGCIIKAQIAIDDVIEATQSKGDGGG